MKEAEERRAQLREKIGRDPAKEFEERMAKLREERQNSPLDKRTEELRARADAARQKHEAFNQELIRTLNEQTELLKKIAERLERG